MVFGFFRKRRDLEERFFNLHNSLNESFSKIKEDMHGVGEWIKHLNETKQEHHERLDDIETRLRVVEEFMNNLMEQSPLEEVSKQLSKQDQTGVCLNQTDRLSKQLSKRMSKQLEEFQEEIELALLSLTTMERAVVWSLLNTDLLLSYEDLSRILGKDRSTVRGQVNNIKRKIPGLILEKSESNGVKRFYIEEDKKREILIKYTGKKVKNIKSKS
jgi:DNA-directed RNA polymerase specialized sigma24 family protein